MYFSFGSLTISLAGVFATAERLQKDYADAELKKQKLPWTKPPRYLLCRVPMQF
jgi:hypothetical protein